MSTQDFQSLFEKAIQPRNLENELRDYWLAPSGTGPLADTWNDKPHRLLYDLLAQLRQTQMELALATDKPCFACGNKITEACGRSASKDCGREHLGGSRSALSQMDAARKIMKDRSEVLKQLED